MSRTSIMPSRPSPALRAKVPRAEMSPASFSRFCMNQRGRRMVQHIPDTRSSRSDRACSRPLRVGASWAAPMAESRTTLSTPARRAAHTAFMLFSGARGPLGTSNHRSWTPLKAGGSDLGSSRSPTNDLDTLVPQRRGPGLVSDHRPDIEIGALQCRPQRTGNAAGGSGDQQGAAHVCVSLRHLGTDVCHAGWSQRDAEWSVRGVVLRSARAACGVSCAARIDTMATTNPRVCEAVSG